MGLYISWKPLKLNTEKMSSSCSGEINTELPIQVGEKRYIHIDPIGVIEFPETTIIFCYSNNGTEDGNERYTTTKQRIYYLDPFTAIRIEAHLKEGILNVHWIEK